MAERWFLRRPAPEGELRVAVSGADVRAAALTLGLQPAALAPAVHDPRLRVLLGGGQAALVRRQWHSDGFAEAVVLRRTGVPLDHPALRALAAGWGCERARHGSTDRWVAVPGPGPEAPLADRFRHLAALAATRVEVAVALARDSGEERTKRDGSPSLAADEAAHAAAVEVLGGLGVTVLSEERRDRPVTAGEPWIVLDPLDGTGNFSAGLPPWAFSAGLVEGGLPVAGLVADLASGRRWTGVHGVGAERDAVPIAPRPGSTVVVPSGPGGGAVAVPSTARRVRVTGCTAVDLCLVADGSASAWHDLDRSGTHVHDVAGGLAVLLAAGGVALTGDGRPLRLDPDTATKIRFVAASSAAEAEELIRAVG
ncbi:inositol monophosphatase family protein [Blastococcus saxobsidens]|uniref:Inositol-1-monophosphatase n=1 Tax=Blastococcus saxobsidens (strain DD2) TaxID=1146883 RepID=H6RQV9_BLASD|nr:inositol monophosphatase family protein [Blastococcus saxobsidens]CCG01636.1 Inositol-1-monophosphatase [Blastococcus saxobsidens DD2]